MRGVDPAGRPYFGPGRPFGGCQPGGFHALFADASVTFFKDAFDPDKFEALVLLTDPAHRRQLAGQIDTVFTDDAACWELGPDGEWTRRAWQDGKPLRDVQESLIDARNQLLAARRARMG